MQLSGFGRRKLCDGPGAGGEWRHVHRLIPIATAARTQGKSEAGDISVASLRDAMATRMGQRFMTAIRTQAHMGSRPIRVVQWATGTVGKAAMRAVITHPKLELVGVKVYASAKEGKDAGELCNMPATGVLAVSKLADILALKPDCLLYMPESTDLDDVCALLEGGINISSTRAEFFNPAAMAPEMRERIERACRIGQSSIHSSGSSPGFITEALPLTLLSLSRRLDLLTIEEFANCIDGCSEEMLMQIMGFGETPENFRARIFSERDQVFNHSLSALAKAIGIEIDRFEVRSEIALAREPTKLHQSTIAAGSVGGQRMITTGYRKDRPIMRFQCTWFVTPDLQPSWPLQADGWRINIEGDTPLDISIGFPIAPDQRAQILPNLTAHRPVNAVEAICAAQAGILTTAELPQILAYVA
ncbi:dihydrodipicolinate reductase [Sphingobium sp. BYY-5]|uniref:NAD(P)H-dependent amine dehydrogenase family protein n=1 Tax=Sphingobium sp. BYY-5 TaxID=2926400 RepID=UPI001FA7427F|nr:dihydrodipicolinate reductase [Sphingobium sp. BYY-5]MCI4592068.1 dihydrodipicolinate reductase [Sphingobium sp. BYY-5]